MGAVLLTLVGPLLLFGVLAALPPGRTLRIALIATGALLALVWVDVALGLPPLMSGDPFSDAVVVTAALVATAAWAAAALAQWARPRLAAKGRLRYPLVVLALLAVLVLVFGPMLLGVRLPGGF